jgi:hypothetical protein
MGPRDLQVFEALAGDLLDELDYPRAVGAIAVDIAAEAEQCRRWWHSSDARD